jgi:hypothetical protein
MVTCKVCGVEHSPADWHVHWLGTTEPSTVTFTAKNLLEPTSDDD